MVDIWGRNAKDENASPTTMINSYAAGWSDLHCSFSTASGHILAQNHLVFSNESQNEQTILGWQAKCDGNSAATLVMEAPSAIKHNELTKMSDDDL